MSAPIAGMSCEKCLYFHRTDEVFGECRRNAPQPNACYYVPKNESVGSVHVDSHWPKVFNNNWCGQFSPRKKVQKTPQKAPTKKIVVQRPASHQVKEELKLRPLAPEKKFKEIPEVQVIE